MKTKSFAVIVSGTAVVALCLAGVCFPQTSIAQTASAPAPGAPDDSTALPPNVDPSSPLAQVVKLTQSGVSESVIMAYVTNSISTFNLNPDQIIYLKDIGVPDELATAMMQRDQVLQAQMKTSQPPPQPAPITDAAVADTTYVAPPSGDVTVNYFYNSLSPYGTWVDVEGYGRCWRPTVVVANAGWQPYCDHGHWVLTDDGWFWISDYSWGWATFHYGRWFHHDHFGWCWVPDTVWGPSWVTWRYSDDYCGWAPLPPRCVYREGVGFFYNGVAVGVGFDFGFNVSCFTFVPTRNFCDPHPRRYRVENREATQIFSRTTVINHFGEDREHRTFINHGIDPRHITEVTHTPIHSMVIRETTTRVGRGEQLGRDGRTLMVNRPHFTDNPSQFPNRGESQHSTPSSPAVGSPNQPSHNGNGNNNSQQPYNCHPSPVGPEVGNPNRTPHNGNQNNNSQQPRNYQPAPTTPTEHSPSPGNYHAPIAPVQPSPPDYNSTDNRRYVSPRTQQTEQQIPRANPGNTGGRVVTPVTPQAPGNPPEANHFTPPPQPPQRNYSAPVTPPSPPVRQPEANHFTPPVEHTAPAQPQERNYSPPRNETPPAESHPSYSQPASEGNQSRGASQSSSSSQSQGSSGRDKNQNGH